MRYIALGYTSGGCSIELIDRYKTSEDLRDIFVLSERQVGRAIRRKLYVFEVCEEPRAECLFLVSFDIKLVKPVNPEKASKDYRKPSHEYRKIREMLYYRLCLGGKDVLDNSTYICFEDASNMVSDYLSERTDADKFKVEVYLVKPYSDAERQLIVEGLNHTVEWLEAQAMSVASRLRSPRGRRAEEKAEALLALVSPALVARVAEKLKALGIDPEPFIRRVNVAREAVEKALKEREAKGVSTAVDQPKLASLKGKVVRVTLSNGEAVTGRVSTVTGRAILIDSGYYRLIKLESIRSVEVIR